MRTYVGGNALWFRAVCALGWANLCIWLSGPFDWFDDAVKGFEPLEVLLRLLAYVAILAPLAVIGGMAIYSRRLPGAWNLAVAAAAFAGPVLTLLFAWLVVSSWGFHAFQLSQFVWAALACGATGCAFASVLCRGRRGEVRQRSYPVWCLSLCGVVGLLAGSAVLANERLMWEEFGVLVMGLAIGQVLATSTAACFGVVALATRRPSKGSSVASV